MLDILNEYGITAERVLSGDTSVLGELRTILIEQDSALKASGKLSKEEVAELKAAAKGNENAVSVAKSAMSTVREACYNAFDAESDSLILMLEELAEFADILEFELKDWIAGKTSVPGETMTREDRVAAVTKLHDLIGKVWILMEGSVNPKDADFSEDGSFPLKTLQKGYAPNLPRKPYTTSENGGTGEKRGRKPSTPSNLVFNWNGNDIPVGTGGPAVIKTMVTNKEFHTTWSQVMKDLEAMGKNLTKDSWSLEFPTGVLKGKVVKG